MNIALWLTQALLAIAFTTSGLMKLLTRAELGQMIPAGLLLLLCLFVAIGRFTLLRR